MDVERLRASIGKERGFSLTKHGDVSNIQGALITQQRVDLHLSQEMLWGSQLPKDLIVRTY